LVRVLAIGLALAMVIFVATAGHVLLLPLLCSFRSACSPSAIADGTRLTSDTTN
jgi:hypothetical protein